MTFLLSLLPLTAVNAQALVERADARMRQPVECANHGSYPFGYHLDNCAPLSRNYEEVYGWLTQARRNTKSDDLKRRIDAHLATILTPTLYFTLDSNWPSGTGTITFQHANIGALQIEVEPIDEMRFFEAIDKFRMQPTDKQRQWRVVLPEKQRFCINTTRFTLPETLPPGLYAMKASVMGNPGFASIARFQVSPFTIDAADASAGSYWCRTAFQAVDAVTGRPIGGAQLDSRIPALSKPVETNAEGIGIASFKASEKVYSWQICLTAGGHSAWFKHNNEVPLFAPKWYHTRWFFDQPGYRPGDTIHFQGFAATCEPRREPSPIGGKPLILKISAMDHSGYTTLLTQTVIPNRNGSFYGSIQIPATFKEGWVEFYINGYRGASDSVWVQSHTHAPATPKPINPPAEEAVDSAITLATDQSLYCVGETARITWSTTVPDAFVRVKAVDRAGICFATNEEGSCGSFSIPITSRMRGGITLQAATTRNNRTHTATITSDVAWGKALTIEPLNLPARFAAGEEQSWRIKLSNPKAKLTATLCDAAFDEAVHDSQLDSDPEAREQIAAWHDFSSLFFSIRNAPAVFAHPAAEQTSHGINKNAKIYPLVTPRPLGILRHYNPPAIGAFRSAAFFKPGLAGDKDGIITLTFTAPKGCWRLNLLAYTDDFSSATTTHLCEAL